MPRCQRVFGEFPREAFAVTDMTDEDRVAVTGARMCGKPAFFKQVSEDGGVTIWICVDCFNEFESQFGEGSWSDTSKFHDGTEEG